MRRHGVILYPSKEQEVIKLMLEQVVADPTMKSDKYEERTNLSASPVPPKRNSSTTYAVLKVVLRAVFS